jgi:hypothetical protein
MEDRPQETSHLLLEILKHCSFACRQSPGGSKKPTPIIPYPRSDPPPIHLDNMHEARVGSKSNRPREGALVPSIAEDKLRRRSPDLGEPGGKYSVGRSTHGLIDRVRSGSLWRYSFAQGVSDRALRLHNANNALL